MLSNPHNTDKVNEFLEHLVGISYNKKCADCGKPGPSWADMTHAFFICYECSALHRRLGVQRSRVKSIQMDSWNMDELRRMHVGGNRYAHKIPKDSDFSVRYEDTHELIDYLNGKEEESIKSSPGDTFMVFSRHGGLKTSNIPVERKSKPKFSDCIESSSEEDIPQEAQRHEDKMTTPEVKADSKENSPEAQLVVSKPGPNLKKSVKPSRSPFSFSIKEHHENEHSDG